MKQIKKILCLALVLGTALSGCGNGDKADAYGNFEADETVVSAQANGQLLSFGVEEGQRVEAGQVMG